MDDIKSVVHVKAITRVIRGITGLKQLPMLSQILALQNYYLYSFLIADDVLYVGPA
jgi:hypothetical protein